MAVRQREKRNAMNSSNPVLGKAFGKNGRGFAAMDSAPVGSNEVADLEATYNAPSASSLRTDRMTIDDVVIKTGFLLGIVVLVGGFAWSSQLGMGWLITGILVGFVLAMVNAFSKTIRPALVISYAVAQGIALGVLSHLYNDAYPGIVSQAVIATIAAFTGVLIMYRSGRLRATPKFTRALMGAVFGYLILAVASIIGSMFFNLGGGYGLYGLSGIGPILSIAGVALASFFLVLDFDQIEKGVKAGAAHRESWRAGFGLLVTIVWLYMEVLRLISILRRD